MILLETRMTLCGIVGADAPPPLAILKDTPPAAYYAKNKNISWHLEFSGRKKVVLKIAWVTLSVLIKSLMSRIPLNTQQRLNSLIVSAMIESVEGLHF